MKKTIIALTLILVFGITSFIVLSQLEGNEVLTSQTTDTIAVSTESPFIEEMLTLAILDEYNASACYQAILDTYGDVNIFSNIKNAEETHISLLIPLLEKYGVDMPIRPDIESIVVPDSLIEAYEIGVEAEILNIALYESYMDLDLPAYIKDVFLKLISGSEHHLSAFEKQVEKY
jgi:hypothetical protein